MPEFNVASLLMIQWRLTDVWNREGREIPIHIDECCVTHVRVKLAGTVDPSRAVVCRLSSLVASLRSVLSVPLSLLPPKPKPKLSFVRSLVVLVSC